MEAVIFDLDGVVVDTEKHWNRAEKEIYREATGSEVDPDRLAGMSITNTYEKLCEDFDVEVSREEFFEMYESRAEEVYCEKAELMEGLKEFIQELRDLGLLIGLATGSYWPGYVIDRFDLDFDAVVDSGDVDGKGKPEPETYRMAVESLGVDPEDAVAVDDTEAGVASAKGAGLYCIGYSESGGDAPSNADEVVDSPKLLRERVFEIVGR
ncbi:HAD-IA family hydrolase [Candidatus Nanohaloarchaea archaeon]|nr:HAD-IA family hydrolase [Candidatus Nanohaloarchaea archaeon]